MATFSVKNYNAGNTPKVLTHIADAGLVLGIFLQSQVPSMPLDDTAKYWTGLSIGTFVVLFKFVSKMFGKTEE